MDLSQSLSLELKDLKLSIFVSLLKALAMQAGGKLITMHERNRLDTTFVCQKKISADLPCPRVD